MAMGGILIQSMDHIGANTDVPIVIFSVLRVNTFGIISRILLVLLSPKLTASLLKRSLLRFPSPTHLELKANEFSGGTWLCWTDHLHVEILFGHFQFIHCRIHCKSSHCSTLVTFVYASPNVTKRKHLWSYIKDLLLFINEPWLILSDFNATTSTKERIGCSTPPDPDFINSIFEYGLHDLGYQGLDFTWSRSNQAVRLDMRLYNEYWLESFPDTLVHHLLRMKSDHRPILAQVDDGSSVRFWHDPWLPSFGHLIDWRAPNVVIDDNPSYP
ncbi:hypothetical protein V6N13_087102 [Hibiscus sabdariffa]